MIAGLTSDQNCMQHGQNLHLSHSEFRQLERQVEFQNSTARAIYVNMFQSTIVNSVAYPVWWHDDIVNSKYAHKQFFLEEATDISNI